MKMLVIGGPSGQVARELAYLDHPDCRIDARGRPNVDLAKSSTLASALTDASPDVVILSGAYTAVDKAEADLATARAVNARGPGAIGSLCAEAGVPVVHLSTEYVFGGGKSKRYVETDATCPLSVYGATKREGEKALAASGVRHVILRVSWVHAPKGKNFVRTMLRLAKSRERINVVADQVGRPTYAPHLAIAIQKIATRLACDQSAPTGIFHLTGSGEPCSRHDYGQAIFAASKARGGPYAAIDPIPTSAYPALARRPANSVMDCSLIADAYGLKLPDWRQGVEECVAAISESSWNVD
ncbi:MAG: dTDP-4-dehydrorhamnose reductase [Verrucomicrobiaceae bacterium]|nr:MAG: dTDP-4-dehydrorhamnose reductase [Verrucomicrobiaceae bacterium]